MKWKLIRKLYRKDGIFGELTSEDGRYFFHTLEHAYKIEDEPYPQSVEYFPKIPEGIHRLVPYYSPKFDMVVPLLDNADDPTDQDRKLEIHIGNYNEDSNGCILIGLGMGPRNLSKTSYMITKSKQAFEQFMKIGFSEIEIIGAP